MDIKITGKNYKISDRLEKKIEDKFSRLGKYFNEDATAHVVLSKFKDRTKLEATINVKHGIFRVEEISDNVYEALDIAVDKLANQMSKFKGKLAARYKENKALKFEFIPDIEDDYRDEDIVIAKTKKFELMPMRAEEAVLQMEMLGHNFYVYYDPDSDTTNIVYKRKGGAYGLIETTR